ncbi:hypothetical protein PG993_009814 [Apiospora rasikravindrae]|uniref:Uncharacterized protein n=1 Tax=Apiospora rasikravindrae TaxID=990691 RepID=A0ABR1SM87_9PEZI
MGGTEGTASGSDDDGGRSGYDVTRTATMNASTKFEFFAAFGIMMSILLEGTSLIALSGWADIHLMHVPSDRSWRVWLGLSTVEDL